MEPATTSPHQPAIRIVNIDPEHIAQLCELQLLCFPTIPPAELFNEENFNEICDTFPAGTFVALEGEKVVGLGSGIYTEFDLQHPHHRMEEVLERGHDPNGSWYYGTDISTHPAWRGRGIGQQLYNARKAVVQRDNKRGIVAGGLIPGFAQHKDAMSVEDYIAQVCAGTLYDSTLTFQLKNGFEVRAILKNYVTVSDSDDAVPLIVWENPDYE